MKNKEIRYHFWAGLIVGALFILAFGWILTAFHAAAETIDKKYTIHANIFLFLFTGVVGFAMGALIESHAKTPPLAKAQLNGTILAAFSILLVDLLREHFMTIPHDTHHMFMTVLIFFVAGATYIKNKNR